MTEIDPIIHRAELVAKLKKSSETIRHWQKQGRLPKPDVHITCREVAWKLSTLQAAGINIV